MTIQLSYTQPGLNPIQDIAGNAAASFENVVVVNNVLATFSVVLNQTTGKLQIENNDARNFSVDGEDNNDFDGTFSVPVDVSGGAVALVAPALSAW